MKDRQSLLGRELVRLLGREVLVESPVINVAEQAIRLLTAGVEREKLVGPRWGCCGRQCSG